MDYHGKTIGLIAGNGDFPLAFLKTARAQGSEVFTAAHIGETKEGVEELSSDVCWVKVGQLGKILDYFSTKKVTHVAFLGGIRRPKLMKGFWPDLFTVKLLAKLRSFRDDDVLRGVSGAFEAKGFTMIDPAEFINGGDSSESLVGKLTKRGFTKQEQEDSEFGTRVAKTIGSFDIGQTVVVLEHAVIAVEGLEGTDQTILRAGELTQKTGGVVVKLKKPHQDKRLDLPSVGEETIRTMNKAGCTALLLEKDGALILDKDSLVRLADSFDIAIEVIDLENYNQVDS